MKREDIETLLSLLFFFISPLLLANNKKKEKKNRKKKKIVGATAFHSPFDLFRILARFSGILIVHRRSVEFGFFSLETNIIYAARPLRFFSFYLSIFSVFEFLFV